MREQTLQFLKSLVETASPSGSETSAAQVFSTYVRPYADRIDTDVLGNVTAILNPGAVMRVMLAAHMDEIGYMIHYIDADGFLHFSSIGGNDSVIAVGQRVWVAGRNRVPGVVGSKAMHLKEPAELGKKPMMTDLWVDIGATSRQEAEAVVAIGDSFTVQTEFQTLLGDRATGRAFDNRLGVTVIAETLRLLSEDGGMDPGVGLYAVATVQEEIGSRGATTAVYEIDPQVAIAIDTGQALDYPKLSASEYGEFFLGGGPGIPRGPNTTPKMFSLLTAAASEAEIPHQVTVSPTSSPTDARALQISRAGCATALVELPIRYMHTPCEVACLSDVDYTARLLAAFCRNLKPDTEFRPG